MAGHQGRILTGLGIAFLCLVGLRAAYLVQSGRLAAPVSWMIILVQVGMGIGIVHGGYAVTRSAVDREHGRQILGWSIGGSVGLVGLATLFLLRTEASGTGLLTSLDHSTLLTAGELGVVGGLGLGYQRAALKQQNQMLQQQRDSFAFLNRMLRHHVLNGISIIRGYAESVQSGGRDESTDSIALILDRSDEITRTVDRVGQMAEIFAGDAPTQRIELTPLLHRLIELKREQHPTVEFTADIPNDVDIAGTELVASGIEELVDNAVVHNDSPVPEVTLRVETDADVAIIRLTDNGPGFDASTLKSMAEPGEYGDEGSGLYLVHTLVDRIGGELSIENHADGATVTIELPRPQ